MSADSNARALSAVHHNRGVPADDGADAAFQRFIAWEFGFTVRRNGVDVISSSKRSYPQLILLGMLQQRKHDVTRTGWSGGLQKRIKGGFPLRGLLGI